jgi:Leucine-rich repeat (LRR) protein
MLGQYLRFSHLMVIQFENLTLSSIPSWLPSIPNLCGLRFFNVTFDSSPIRLFHCRNLDFLNIIKCGLKEVPDDLKMLSKLRSVNFEGNQIEKFPDVLFKLPALISIQLSGNPITKIPDSWASLPNLERLQLMECQITHFPEDLYRIPFVTLSSNPLEINNCERLDGVLWPKPWRFEEILAKIRRGQLLDELEILHPLFAKYRTQLLAQCEGIQNAAVNQICNTPVGIGAAAGHEILL